MAHPAPRAVCQPAAASVTSRQMELLLRTNDAVLLSFAQALLKDAGVGPDFAIERMLSEMSAYYLLGVQPEEADRDGRGHAINVKVNQRDSSVRNRRTVVIPKPS